MYQDIIYPEIISGDKNSLIKEAYLFSCRKDVEALKPGNVYLSSPHADTNSNDYIKSLNVPAVDTIIGNRQIYASSMGEGKTAIEKQRKGSAVDEIKKLSDQILSELN